MLFWRKTTVFAVTCLTVVFSWSNFIKELLILLSKAITLPAHYQPHCRLPPLKNSDVTYVFHLCILESISCHYFFPFFLKFITQYIQDNIVSFVLASVTTIFFTMNFLMNKTSIRSPLSHISFTSSPFASDFLTCHSMNAGLTDAPKCQNPMTSFQISCSSTCHPRSTLSMSIKKLVDFENTHI